MQYSNAVVSPWRLTVQVEDLARLSFKRQPLYVGVDDRQDAATREGLEQGYCVRTLCAALPPALHLPQEERQQEGVVAPILMIDIGSTIHLEKFLGQLMSFMTYAHTAPAVLMHT